MSTAVSYPNPVKTPPHPTEPHGHVVEIPTRQEPKKWKIARISIALPLMALSGGALLPFAVVPVSTQAVVNARLSEIRTPIEGTIQDISLEPGDLVHASEPVARITAARGSKAVQKEQDHRTIFELKSRVSEIDAQLAADQKQLASANALSQNYIDHLSGELQFQLDMAVKQKAVADSKLSQLNLEVTRDSQALQDHLVTRTVLDQATERQERARTEAEAAADKVSHLKTELSDVKSGYLLGAGSEPPAFVQDKNNAAAEVARLTEGKSALEAQIADFQNDTSDSVKAASKPITVRSPVSGTVWARSAAPAQGVAEGDDLFRVADSDSIHVEVWVDRRYGPQLSIGDVALVYLSGMGKELTGRVISFQGSSRRRLDEEVNAIDLQPVHPDQYHVSIELDPSDRNAAFIGQPAKVIFPGSKGRFRARLYSWLARL